MSGAWDPEQYMRFADERSRPFEDLLARVSQVFPGAAGAAGGAPALVVDLGCGPGT